MTPPFTYTDFERADIGIDETNGRFGEVSVETCKKCGSIWLEYLVEFEGVSNSGRWYRGPISEETAQSVKPESAVEALEKLEWYFVGGSYFRSQRRRGSGPLSVDA